MAQFFCDAAVKEFRSTVQTKICRRQWELKTVLQPRLEYRVLRGPVSPAAGIQGEMIALSPDTRWMMSSSAEDATVLAVLAVLPPAATVPVLGPCV